MTFENALSYCRDHYGTNLAMPKTYNNWLSMTNLFTFTKRQNWLGITEIQDKCYNASECNFLWIDGTPFEYSSDIHAQIPIQFDRKPDEVVGVYYMGKIHDETNATINNNIYPTCQKCRRGKLNFESGEKTF